MSDLPFDRQQPARPRAEQRPAPRPVSPDCAQGKHVACSGDAWDDEADGPAACSCNCPHY